MKILICEPNLVGFLSAFYETYYTHKDAGLITSDPSRVTLFDVGVNVPSDLATAEKVRAGIINKFGVSSGRGCFGQDKPVNIKAAARKYCPIYKEIIDAYLCCNPNKEQILSDYIRLLLREGRRALNMYADERVMLFNDILRKVRGERHRLEGFVRLQQTDNGTYYGYFTADNDILEILTEEIVKGFNSEKLILHDAGRKKLIYYDGSRCHKLLAPDGVDITLSQDEQDFQRLWKQYFNKVSIASRVNPRLQRGFLPKKYRHFMHEF